METIEYSSETIRLRERLSTERRFFLIIIGCLLLLNSILYVNFSNLEKEFNVSDFDVLKSYEECDYIKIWETYEGTRDLMFL